MNIHCFFFNKFRNLLENLSSIPGELIILCDFNLHLEIPSHHTETFTDNLTSFGLLQHVNFPTHIHGHWLDLCITRSASQIVSSIFPSDGLSDHLTVKIFSDRIRSHLDKNNLSNPNQSAYKPLHSTETALLKIHNALVLLDLSAAFDTLDHSSIIELLSGSYGISGTALNWIRSYLSNRVQRVKLLDKLGEPSKTDYGVPQGSVLGPLLFTLCTTPLSSVMSRHNICHHLYADDTQIYLSLSKTDPEMSLSLVQQCLQDVSNWMIAGKFKLNPDKT